MKIPQQPKSSGGNTSYCPSSRGWSPFAFWCAEFLPVCGICIHANRCLCCLCAAGVHGVRDACLSDDDTGCRQLPNVVSGSSTSQGGGRRPPGFEDRPRLTASPSSTSTGTPPLSFDAVFPKSFSRLQNSKKVNCEQKFMVNLVQSGWLWILTIAKVYQ